MNLSFRRSIVLILVSVFLLIAAGIALAYIDAWREESTANRLMLVLSRIQVGSSTETDVSNIALAFSQYARREENSDPQKGLRSITYGFQNRVMASLHLAPWKVVHIEIDFNNGLVVSKSLNFYQQPRSGVMVKEVVASDGGASTNIKARQIHTIIYGPDRVVIEVRDDSSVPLSRRQLDWEVDLSCMREMGRCGDPHRLLPGITQ